MSPVLVNPSRFGAAAATYDSVLAGLNVVGDWKLDEASGTVAAANGHGSDGGLAPSGVTYSQAALVNDGGTSLAFDGSTGEVSVPTTGILSTAGALAVWVKTTDAVMVRDHVTTAAGWMLASNGGSLAVRVNSTTSVGSGFTAAAVNDGARHLLILSTDGTTVTVYLDGTAGTPISASAAFSTMHTPLHFGRSGANLGSTNFFAGTYDRITLFGANLSSTDVTNLWNAGK